MGTSVGSAASSNSGLIPLKTAYKKEENCSGQSRVRRILLTCIQLLFLQFLHVIQSMRKISHFLKNRSIIFFINLTIPRSIVYKYTLHVLRPLKIEKAFKQGLKYNKFPPQILCLHVSVLVSRMDIFLAIFLAMGAPLARVSHARRASPIIASLLNRKAEEEVGKTIVCDKRDRAII